MIICLITYTEHPSWTVYNTPQKYLSLQEVIMKFVNLCDVFLLALES